MTLSYDLVFNLVQLAVDALAIGRLVQLSRSGPVGMGGWVVVVLAGLSAVALSFAPLSQHFDLFLLFRMLSWAMFVHGPLVFLVAAWFMRGPSRVGFGALGVSLATVGAWAFLVEPSRLEVNHHTVVVPGLTKPLRVAVVADLQTDRVTAHERRALTLVRDSEPDVVLFAGDLVQHHAPDRYAAIQRDVNALFVELLPRDLLGIVAVKGNVDWGPGDWTAAFDGLPVHASNASQQLDLGPLVVTALSFEDGFDADLVVPDPGRPHLVLAHGPDFALGSIGADVLVAGHTHGGQLDLPGLGPVITLSQVPREWASGRSDTPGGTLFVSRGVGMEREFAPRFRLFAPPEILILDLRPE